MTNTYADKKKPSARPLGRGRELLVLVNRLPADQPEVGALTYNSRNPTENGETRIAISSGAARFNRRFVGYLGAINDAGSKNSAPPYWITAVGLVALFPYDRVEPIGRYVAVWAITSNFLAADLRALLLRGLVAGAISASYGGYMADFMDFWKLADSAEWDMLRPSHDRAEILALTVFGGPFRDY